MKNVEKKGGGNLYCGDGRRKETKRKPRFMVEKNRRGLKLVGGGRRKTVILIDESKKKRKKSPCFAGYGHLGNLSVWNVRKGPTCEL